eukprot:1014800_1
MEPTTNNEATTGLNELPDDVLIHCLQFLEFEDIIHGIIPLNKRLNSIQSNPHILYSLQFGIYVHNNQTKDHNGSVKLMAKYCKHLIENNCEDTFIYRKMKKIFWTVIRGVDDRTDVPQWTQLLFANLYDLEDFTIYIRSFDELSHMPTQKK